MSKVEFAAIIHGGLWFTETQDPIVQERRKNQQRGLGIVIESCADLLSSGGTAVDVVENVVRMLEDDPAFNAGKGAEIDEEGNITLDASIMDGKTLDCGAVTGVERYANPILIARLVMNTKEVFLSKEGAHRLAEQHGFPQVTTEQLRTPFTEYLWKNYKAEQEARQHGTGTVGAVVRDRDGNIAAGTSTGGFTGKPLGRIGDSPMIGAGTYADNRFGGASATGVGEQIIKVGLTKQAIELIRANYSPEEACRLAIKELGQLERGEGGIILISKNLDLVAETNVHAMPRAFVTSSMTHPEVKP